MNDPHFYSIGTPGQPWGDAELAQWRSLQVRQRSYPDDVLAAVHRLRDRMDVVAYGEVVYADGRFPLFALRSPAWNPALPSVLVTGGVHGYETSGVHGALRFLDRDGEAFADRVNLLVVPCVSPWAYEHIQRWNFDAIDPNRSFREPSPSQEAAALMRLVAPLHGQFVAHIDLHETTNTDESEYRPAVAARDGKVFVPGSIPDGFLPGGRHGQPATCIPAGHHRGRGASHPHRPCGREERNHRFTCRGTRCYPVRHTRAGLVPQCEWCALHHDHGGVSRQPPCHTSAVCGGTGIGGVCGGGFCVRAVRSAIC